MTKNWANIGLALRYWRRSPWQ